MQPSKREAFAEWCRSLEFEARNRQWLFNRNEMPRILENLADELVAASYSLSNVLPEQNSLGKGVEATKARIARSIGIRTPKGGQ